MGMYVAYSSKPQESYFKLYCYNITILKELFFGISFKIRSCQMFFGHTYLYYTASGGLEGCGSFFFKV